jgi:hypothetical protein
MHMHMHTHMHTHMHMHMHMHTHMHTHIVHVHAHGPSTVLEQAKAGLEAAHARAAELAPLAGSGAEAGAELLELRPRAARAEAEMERLAGELAVVQQAARDAAEAARGAAEAAAEELRGCRSEVGRAEERLEARGRKCGYSK